jgi:hypothetical protein
MELVNELRVAGTGVQVMLAFLLGIGFADSLGSSTARKGNRLRGLSVSQARAH